MKIFHKIAYKIYQFRAKRHITKELKAAGIDNFSIEFFTFEEYMAIKNKIEGATGSVTFTNRTIH